MKKIFSIFVTLLIFTSSLFAQLPQHYNFNTQGGNNSFPFGIATGKMLQALVVAGELSQPSPAPSGNITKFYYRVNETYPFNSINYSFLYILMGQANITTLPTGAFYTGTLDTVFKGTNYLINAAGGTWVQFNLTTPFAYNNTQGLVIEIGQFGFSGSNFFPACNTNLTGIRRSYSVGGPPFVYSGQGVQMMACGVDIAQPPTGPNYLHYKFEENPSPTSVWNCGNPGVGNNPSTMTGLTLTTGGQFDSCIQGAGTASGGITTGWNCNLGSSSWTISMWLTIPTTSSGSAFYLFGDAGSQSFRCFHNGVAGVNNLVLRKTGMTDVPVTGIGPAPTVVTFVFDSAMAQIRAYKNGVLANTVAQTSFNIPTGTGFKVGGYSTSTTFVGKMDEFRLYRRALSPAEITATWNQDIACGIILGVNNSNNQVPNTYRLDQNYPNPFNPVTTISFGIPKASNVRITVYDLLGREIEVLVNEFVIAGNYNVNFDASNLSSGVYMYKLEADGYVNTKKMMLIK